LRKELPDSRDVPLIAHYLLIHDRHITPHAETGLYVPVGVEKTEAGWAHQEGGLLFQKSSRK
jgi:hypothetical protein